MKRSDFDFDLPPQLIAQQPLPQRSDSRLLVVAAAQLHDRVMAALPEQLLPGDLLVFNNTRVIPARLAARKSSGGQVEIMIERVVDEQHAWAFLRASKTPRVGSELWIDETPVTVLGRDEALFQLQLGATPAASIGWMDLLAAHGEVPLPPYIQRPPDVADQTRYQTVYASEPGAVAAPTAGLHFDQALLDTISSRGVSFGYLTLHVGAGTFAPVREESLADHRMHAERFSVAAPLVEQIRRTRAAGGRVVAVGTTVVRALETAAADGELAALEGESRLFIRPGFSFRVVDALLTNFHLPQSTLLMLVCAFAGQDRVLAAYRHAVAQAYRFFSYGDAMWLERAR